MINHQLSGCNNSSYSPRYWPARCPHVYPAATFRAFCETSLKRFGFANNSVIPSARDTGSSGWTVIPCPFCDPIYNNARPVGPTHRGGVTLPKRRRRLAGRRLVACTNKCTGSSTINRIATLIAARVWVIKLDPLHLPGIHLHRVFNEG